MQMVTVFENLESGQFFFSTDHSQRFPSNQESALEEFVPVTTYLPMPVRPCPEIPSGMLTTREDVVVYSHKGQQEIPNPDPAYQA